MILTITALLKLQSPTDWKPIASYLTFILLAFQQLCQFFCLFPLSPSGPYQVGMRIYELTDTFAQGKSIQAKMKLANL